MVNDSKFPTVDESTSSKLHFVDFVDCFCCNHSYVKRFRCGSVGTMGCKRSWVAKGTSNNDGYKGLRWVAMGTMGSDGFDGYDG